MTATIRTADLTDAAEARALGEILDSYAQGQGGQNAPLTQQALDQLAPGLLGLSSAFVLMAYLDDKPVGAAVCFWGFSTFAGKPTVNIHDFAVLPAYRGQGIGGSLLAKVEDIAREQGCSKITLEVHASNEGAKRLYRESGFGPWDSPTYFVSKHL